MPRFRFFRRFRRSLTAGGFTALSLGVSSFAAAQAREVPVGTPIPIRFLTSLRSGKDTIGTPVTAESIAPVLLDSCTVVPPYARASGRIVRSRRGGWFGGRGELRIHFDSIELGRNRWVSLTAVLDSLEYTAAANVEASGAIRGNGGSLGRRLLPSGALAVPGVLAVIPSALIGGFFLSRRGGGVRIVAGEIGRLRLTGPLELTQPVCTPAVPGDLALQGPELPPFELRTAKKNRAAGDVINVVFLGTRQELDSAFRNAGWIVPDRRRFHTVAWGIMTAIFKRQNTRAPMSAQYFDGRPEDVAYEVAGPHARIRHHIRLWSIDSLKHTWVGAANKDIGLLATKATHKISPEIDGERDYLVRTLEAGNCARLVEYRGLPGAVTEAKNGSGQKMHTDGRAAIIRGRPCDSDRDQ